MKWNTVLALAAVALLLGCGTETTAPGNSASAGLVYATGGDVGSAQLTESDEGVRLVIEAKELSSGDYAVQLVDGNACEPPHFMGPDNSPPLDLGPLQVGENEEGLADLMLSDVTLAPGGDSTLLNKSLILTSSNGLGVRVACGVIEAD